MKKQIIIGLLALCLASPQPWAEDLGCETDSECIEECIQQGGKDCHKMFCEEEDENETEQNEADMDDFMFWSAKMRIRR